MNQIPQTQPVSDDKRRLYSGIFFLAGLKLLRGECRGDSGGNEPWERRGKEYHGPKSFFARKQSDKVVAGFKIKKDIDYDPEQKTKQRTLHIGVFDIEHFPFIKPEKEKHWEKTGDQSE